MVKHSKENVVTKKLLSVERKSQSVIKLALKSFLFYFSKQLLLFVLKLYEYNIGLNMSIISRSFMQGKKNHYVFHM